VTERVTEKENEVLLLIQIDPGYTYADMAEKLSVSRKTISARIKSLKDKEIIRRIGSDTNGYWEIISK
jgi:ATP-dependent DNA helicase RecG